MDLEQSEGEMEQLLHELISSCRMHLFPVAS